MEDVKQTPREEDNELRSEHDLKSLRVRKLGPDRKRFGKTSIETEKHREYPSGDCSEDKSNESDLC